MGQRYGKMENWRLGPRLACNLDFAKGKGLKPKVKKCSKIFYVGRRGEQTCLTQTYHKNWGLGVGRLDDYFLILGEK